MLVFNPMAAMAMVRKKFPNCAKVCAALAGTTRGSQDLGARKPRTNQGNIFTKEKCFQSDFAGRDRKPKKCNRQNHQTAVSLTTVAYLPAGVAERKASRNHRRGVINRCAAHMPNRYPSGGAGALQPERENSDDIEQEDGEME
jgi:hypothetical protein